MMENFHQSPHDVYLYSPLLTNGFTRLVLPYKLNLRLFFLLPK